ncbi:unnamed protein product [Dibothriocephalus latus]|uniref:Uncharacterized protein n=1 Tax=Dibothriocephalus latus TaxID=60516 RepID=A0A3P7P2Q8_DIBLA|nr:unnamed protein product [Dibothriocephalus latus]
MVGGWQYSARVSEFLPREPLWRERDPLAVGRYYHAAAVVQEAEGVGRALLGVFGGLVKEGSYLSSCEVYDVRQDR